MMNKWYCGRVNSIDVNLNGASARPNEMAVGWAANKTSKGGRNAGRHPCRLGWKMRGREVRGAAAPQLSGRAARHS